MLSGVEAAVWIALGSLVVSVAALGVAVFALRYARSQAQQARRQAQEAARANQLAEQRHHEDIAPTFTLSLRQDGEVHVRLLLELVPGHVDLDALEVEIVDDGNLDGQLVEFTDDRVGVQDGVQAGASRPRRRARWPVLRRGERAIWRVVLPESDRAARLRLRVTSHAGEQTWSTVVETPVEPALLDTIW